MTSVTLFYPNPLPNLEQQARRGLAAGARRQPRRQRPRSRRRAPHAPPGARYVLKSCRSDVRRNTFHTDIPVGVTFNEHVCEVCEALFRVPLSLPLRRSRRRRQLLQRRCRKQRCRPPRQTQRTTSRRQPRTRPPRLLPRVHRRGLQPTQRRPRCPLPPWHSHMVLLDRCCRRCRV